MEDKFPKGYNYKIDDGSIVFIGRINNDEKEVYVYIRDKNGKDYRICLSEIQLLVLNSLIENRDNCFKENELFIGDEGIKYGVKITNFDVPKKEKEPQKKPLFDWE